MEKMEMDLKKFLEDQYYNKYVFEKIDYSLELVH
jgi:hypothetical protein